eukprot:gene34475-41737_t
MVNDNDETVQGEVDVKVSNNLSPTHSLSNLPTKNLTENKRRVNFLPYCDRYVPRPLEEEAILIGLREKSLVEIWGGIGVGKRTLSYRITEKISMDPALVFDNALEVDVFTFGLRRFFSVSEILRLIVLQLTAHNNSPLLTDPLPITVPGVASYMHRWPCNLLLMFAEPEDVMKEKAEDFSVLLQSLLSPARTLGTSTQTVCVKVLTVSKAPLSFLRAMSAAVEVREFSASQALAYLRTYTSPATAKAKAINDIKDVKDEEEDRELGSLVPLETALATAYSLLDGDGDGDGDGEQRQEKRRALCVLALFPADFSLPDALAVWEADGDGGSSGSEAHVRGVLQELLDKHWLRRSDNLQPATAAAGDCGLFCVGALLRDFLLLVQRMGE